VEQASVHGVPQGSNQPQGEIMKKFSYALAALATIAIAAPAVAEDKPMMKKDDMGMHHSMRHHHEMMMHHKTHMIHHKKMMMKKDNM
jgi:Spy/CpxP family protein refolding chaperone